MRMVLSPAVVATATVVTASAINIVNAADPPAPAPAPAPAPPPPSLECDPDKPLVRAKDLPIYFTPDDKIIKQPKPCEEEEQTIDDALMNIVKEGRKTVWKARDQFSELSKSIDDFVETGKAHLETSIQQLREPENSNLRYGVIGGGGFVGLLLSLRGGIFKKIFYTSAGALAMATVCFPDEASEYSSKLYNSVQEYSSLAYHFTNADDDDNDDKSDQPQTRKVNSDLTSVLSYDISNLLNYSENIKSFNRNEPIYLSSSEIIFPKATKISTNQLNDVKDDDIDDDTQVLRDQSNPDDRDMYSLRG